MLNRKRKNVMISLGLLLSLDHFATVTAFLELASKTNQPLSPQKIKEAMPTILHADEQVKTGKIDTITFRFLVLKALNVNANDTQFDAAWNAMLGDVVELHAQLTKIKAQDANTHYILLSKTNPIHMQFIINRFHPEIDVDANLSNPLTLLGIPLYVSYLSRAFTNTLSMVVFYNEILSAHRLVAAETEIVIPTQSESAIPLVKAKDDETIKLARQWAFERGVGIINRQPEQDVTVCLEPALTMQGYGLKHASGTFSIWASANLANTQTNYSLDAHPQTTYRR